MGKAWGGGRGGQEKGIWRTEIGGLFRGIRLGEWAKVGRALGGFVEDGGKYKRVEKLCQYKKIFSKGMIMILGEKRGRNERRK